MKKTFEDWLGDLREEARVELGVELEEIDDWSEDDALDAFRCGLKPRTYVKEMERAHQSKEDVDEIMREL